MVDFSILTHVLDRDPTIGWRIQFEELVIGLDVPNTGTWTLHVGPEQISLIDGLANAATFTFTASSKAWVDYATGIPPVGAQSIASLVETGQLTVTADATGMLAYCRHAMLIEKLFSHLRGLKPVTARPYGKVEVEPIVGRYIRLDIDSRPHRVYYEEAGQGMPLLCLHTAGSDGRQYRGIMNDRRITERFRVIAFDLPWHGKSAPPPGFQNELYRLTTDAYVGIVMAVKNALQLDNPVVMGCSIGGRAVLHLALRHGREFRGAIGLQSAAHCEMRTPKLLGTETAGTLFRPDMDSGDLSAAGVMAVMGPTSPAEDEWETLYYYMQSAPGVFQGDLYYYLVDGDLRGRLAGLDTVQCPLYLLTGDYDLTATPQMTRELADTVNATYFAVMGGLGHFPMSEDPARFREYLYPVLDKIIDRREG